ncbi:MAG: hypothetical protein GWP06_09625 [Actinobacteria bacterium]|nr:hypothetical protein [Actinomycetota bacterium]
MSFDKILGQKRPKEIVQKALKHNRLASGYLFSGAEGAGKEALAIEFAKAIFCTSEKTKPCNACSGCRRVGNFNHPDLIFIFPKPKTASVDNEREILDSLSKNPYLRKRPWASPGISINQIRELRHVSTLKPMEGHRVVIIAEADKMTVEAENALLKLLEEPPPSMHLVLTSARPNILLPTIISRCQEIRFGLISDQEIEETLIREKQISPEQARLISKISQGSYRRAMELAEEDLAGRRETAVELVRGCLRDNLSKFSLIEKTIATYDKRSVKELLSLMLIWFRDALILANDENEKDSLKENIINLDQLETLQKFVTAFRQINFEEIFSEIEKSIELVDRNVQLNLILIVLFTRLAKIISHKG